MVAGHGQGAGPGGLQEAAGRHHCMLSALIIVIDKFYMLALLPILVFRIECRTACDDDPPNHGPPLTSGEVMSSIS